VRLSREVRPSEPATPPFPDSSPVAAISPLTDADPAVLEASLFLLESASRLEGYVAEIRLDGTVVSFEQAIHAVRDALARARAAHSTHSRHDEGNARDPSGRATDTAAAVRFVLDVIDLPPAASPSEVRRAFRRAVLRLHPDVRSGEPQAHDEFVLLKRGYDEVLRRSRLGA
jgi:hypothetical protein